jgi:hypothetical protein
VGGWVGPAESFRPSVPLVVTLARAGVCLFFVCILNQLVHYIELFGSEIVKLPINEKVSAIRSFIFT